MEHGLDVTLLAVVAASALVWSLLSARLERVNISAPMAFVVLGLVFAHRPLAVIDVQVSSSTARSVAELTLALVLFVDASRVNVRALRRDAVLPIRLLAIGLPLTIGAGLLVAVGLYRGVGLWVVAVIATSVAPTDAALGAPIMGDTRIPGRVRRVLNVESGLNDGIVTPFVGICLGRCGDLGGDRRILRHRWRGARPARWRRRGCRRRARGRPCSCDWRSRTASACPPSARWYRWHPRCSPTPGRSRSGPTGSSQPSSPAWRSAPSSRPTSSPRSSSRTSSASCSPC